MSPLVSFDDLLKEGIRYAKRHLRRLEQQDRFPRRVRSSPGKGAWLESEVEAFKASLVAKRNEGAT